MKYINIKVLKTESHYVAPTSLALSMQNRLVSKLERPKPICLCLPGAAMPGFTHQLLTATFMTLKGQTMVLNLST